METTIIEAPAETMASIRVFGVGLDFDTISRELGAQPSESHRRGERSLTSRAYGEDMWCLDSPYPKTEGLGVHLRWLRQALLARYDFVRWLREKHEVSSYCGVSVDGDRCQFQVSADALAIFVELGIDMDLSFVFAGYSDPDLRSQGSTQVRPNLKGSNACLRATGIRLDLDRISTGLRLEPSQTHRAGDLDRSGRPYPNDLWALVTPLPRTDELDAHLRWLGNALLRYSDFLRSLKREAQVLVHCDFGTQSDRGGVSISAEGLRVCTEPDITLEFKAFLMV